MLRIAQLSLTALSWCLTALLCFFAPLISTDSSLIFLESSLMLRAALVPGDSCLFVAHFSSCEVVYIFQGFFG